MIRRQRPQLTQRRSEEPISGSSTGRLRWSAVIRLWGLSIAMTLAAGSGAWMIWQQILAMRAEDPAYQLAAIIQTGPEVEVLPTGYLEELLGLSQDHPINLYRLPLASLTDRLLASPCIAKAQVHRVPPKAIKICYEARQPVAICSDLRNALIDAEGVLLPYQPYFRPRRLPQVYLGILHPEPRMRSSEIWGKRIPTKLAQQTHQILTHGLWGHLELLWLDLSHSLDENMAARQIIAKCRLPNMGTQCWIRLASSHWQEGLSQLHSLCEQPELLKGIEVIDLRMPKMAILVPTACDLR